MTRDEVKAIFESATDEQLNSVMSLNGAAVEKAKNRAAALEQDLKKQKEAYDALAAELGNLKTSSAAADDYKSKYEALLAQNEAEKKQAEADRIAKEKADNLSARFDAVLGNKKFSHEAIREAYAKKFGEALSDKANDGKSDADIFHALTKDDAAAFENVTAVRLAGGKAMNIGSRKQYNSKDDIMKIRDAAERQSAIRDNPDLFMKGD